MGVQSKTRLCTFKGCIFLKYQKTTCFGHSWPSSGFIKHLRLCYINHVTKYWWGDLDIKSLSNCSCRVHGSYSCFSDILRIYILWTYIVVFFTIHPLLFYTHNGDDTLQSKNYALKQCFSTFVRPRPCKFFFYKTRAPPGPNKFTRKYLSNFFMIIY
jgi:hypothetical protein